MKRRDRGAEVKEQERERWEKGRRIRGVAERVGEKK